MALGSLVVSLGLDAAQFTAGLSRAEYQARQLGQSIGDGIGKAAGLAATGLAALGVSAAGALSGFNALLDGASKFADLSDKTGASAEALASFAVAAGTSGTSMDTIAAAANKLTQNLVGVDDESKAAGAALAAMGIPMKDFKALKPDEQLEKVSKTLAGFADGAGKTAVAMALFGKSGAEVLPFLKTLEEQGGRQKILTQEQIELSDAYLDRQAKTKTELQLYAQALATQAVPALTAFTGALTDTTKEILGVVAGSKDLKNSQGVQDFAEAAVRALGFVVDAADGVVRGFQAAGNLLGGLGAAAAAVASGDFRAAVSIAQDTSSTIEGILSRPLFSDKLDKRLAEMKAKANTPDPKPADAPDLNFTGAKTAGKKDTTAAQEAKARLHLDLDAIKNATDAITNAYGNQERLLEAQRAAGLKDEEVYYAEKGRLLALNVAAQDNALQQQLARLKRESLTGKDQIENLKKIAGVEADLAKLRENAATSTQILGIQQTDALKKIADKFNAAEAAARAYVDAISNQNGRELAGMGMGPLQRDKDARLAQREDALQARREALTAQLSAGQISQDDYDRYLGIQEAAHTRALASDTAYWEAKMALQGNWVLGAQEGLATYYEESQKLYDQVQKAGLSAFKGLEDALVSFATTGKLSFTSLVDSIIADIARITIRQQITGPLAKSLSEGGKDGGIFGAIGSWFTSLVGGGRATGGNIQPNTLYRVNENGPELLDYNGKQYLMNGDKNGQITANGKFGGGSAGGGIEVVIQNNGAPATAEVKQSQSADGGMRIDVIMNAVKDAVADDMISRRGSIGRAMNNGAFGARAR